MRLRGRREGVRRLRVAGGVAERPLRLVGLNVGVSSATRLRAAAILSRNSSSSLRARRNCTSERNLFTSAW